MKSVGLWILVIVITLASAVYQRMTGPTYPVSGTADFAGTKIKYKLTRTHAGPGDQPIAVSVPDASINAVLIYKRYPTNEEWTRITMQRDGEMLKAALPHQLPAGKIEYYVQLSRANTTLILPGNESIITRFRGDVPPFVIIPHILSMFLGMLFSTRAGLEALKKDGNLKKFVFITIGFIVVGGMFLGPLVQKYAFGAYWTGFPNGTDLTDNKTLIALIGWLVAAAGIFLKKKPRLLVGIAAIVTLMIFMIPHSMAGSQLDYSKMENGEQVIKVE